MKKRRRNILIIIAVLIIICIALVVYFFRVDLSKKKDEEVSKLSYIDIIKGYDYTLEERDTKLFKDTYYQLKEVLSSSEINYEEYAKLLSELYVIDLYTIDNKFDKYDVGATEYIYTDGVENFILKVDDTIYKYVEDYKDGKRKQDLPIVESITVSSVEEEKFQIGEEELDGYKVNVKWEYKEDLDYDTEAIINLVKKDDKLYIVSQTNTEDEKEVQK